MWWFFKPSCPVDDKTRMWVDQRMNWLAAQFGLDRWWSAPAIEPTDEFFPDKYDCSELAVDRMLGRVCTYMEVDPNRVTLRLYSEDKTMDLGNGFRVESKKKKGSAGQYSVDDKEIISIESSILKEPDIVAATLAHELSHVRLLGEGRVTGDEKDHEQLTDLATVFFGMGIFNANGTIRFGQNSQGWQTGKLGYLTEKHFGYALGVWTYVRGEESPHWMRHLRPSVRNVVKKTLRYLHANEKNVWARRRRRNSPSRQNDAD